MITLFEHQYLPYQELNLPTSDPLLDAIDQVNQKAGRELIRLERKGLRATQFVGVIHAGGHMIQILPKIDCDPDGFSDAPVGSKPHELASVSAAKNFLFLLAHARRLKLHNQTIATLHKSRGAWLEMLTRLFVSELMVQLQQGFNQDYVRKEEILPYVRGRWNIARQFGRHPILSEGLDVSYDDYSPDTLLNRVFRLAVEGMQKITRDQLTRQMLTNLETWLLPVKSVGQLSTDELDSVQFTRLNERFQPAFQLARLFLEGQTVQLLIGGQRAFAFVFDMDRLFEQFVVSLLLTRSLRILPEQWVDSQIELQGSISKKYLIERPYPTEKPIFLLKPDILLRLYGVPLLIIDTKNKALPSQWPYRFVAEGDAYQMVAYALSFGCSNVLLLYPRLRGAAETPPYSLKVDGTPFRLFVGSLDLHQPLGRLDKLVGEFHRILNHIYKQEVNPEEVLWPV